MKLRLFLIACDAQKCCAICLNTKSPIRLYLLPSRLLQTTADDCNGVASWGEGHDGGALILYPINTKLSIGILNCEILKLNSVEVSYFLSDVRSHCMVLLYKPRTAPHSNQPLFLAKLCVRICDGTSPQTLHQSRKEPRP